MQTRRGRLSQSQWQPKPKASLAQGPAVVSQQPLLVTWRSASLLCLCCSSEANVTPCPLPPPAADIILDLAFPACLTPPRPGLARPLSTCQTRPVLATPCPARALALCCLRFTDNATGPRTELGGCKRRLLLPAAGALCEGGRSPPDMPPQGSWALGPRPLSPVGHVVEVLRELGQVGALLLVLLFCPKQNLRNLKKEADWIGLEASGFPVTGRFSRSGTSSAPRPAQWRTSIL